MRAYMPRHHFNFLHHLGAALRPLRVAVARMGDAALTEAYNAAVDSLHRFCDAILVSWRSTSLARRIAEHPLPLLLLGLKLLLLLPLPIVAIAEVCESVEYGDSGWRSSGTGGAGFVAWDGGDELG